MYLFSLSVSSSNLLRRGVAGAILSFAGLITAIGSKEPGPVKADSVIPSVNRSLDEMVAKQTDGNSSNSGQTINNIQDILSQTFPPFFNFPFQMPLLEKKYIEPEVSVKFREISGFDKREEYLKDVLELLNPHLLQESNILGKKTALSEFNKKQNMNFECLSVRGNPCEFVFIDKNYFLKSGIGKTNIPRRIAVSLEEAQSMQSKQDVMNLLEWKLLHHEKSYAQENKMWDSPFTFDFPKNKGACMVALALNPKRGMETDVIYALNVYTKEFGMSTYALPVSLIHRDDMFGVLQNHGYENLLKDVVPATKDSILKNLEMSLKKAVDDKKDFFVFHYLTHGAWEGAVCAEDQKFDPVEIAQTISKSYNGEPLCSKLDIYIQAGACYSGQQLERMANYFKENKNIPVKNLYIVCESNYTTAVFSTTWQKISLIQDESLVCDMTGPQAYFDSWVKSYSEYLKSKDEEVRPEVATMLWRLRFADLMTWYDEKQNMKGFHYSNDPKKNRNTQQYFTELIPPIDENPGSQSLYAQLEDLKDAIPGLRWSQYLNDLRT